MYMVTKAFYYYCYHYYYYYYSLLYDTIVKAKGKKLNINKKIRTISTIEPFSSLPGVN